MMRFTRLAHRFVRNVPEQLESGVLYVSMEFATGVHSCCCGCGEEIVTPFTPTDWKMTYDGESVSLWPSIGNWNLHCRSHYIIDRGRVVEAGAWTDGEIEAERDRDKAAKAQYYKPSAGVPAAKPNDSSATTPRSGWSWLYKVNPWR